jgi:hypothetical protein
VELGHVVEALSVAWHHACINRVGIPAEQRSWRRRRRALVDQLCGSTGRFGSANTNTAHRTCRPSVASGQRGDLSRYSIPNRYSSHLVAWVRAIPMNAGTQTPESSSGRRVSLIAPEHTKHWDLLFAHLGCLFITAQFNTAYHHVKVR